MTTATIATDGARAPSSPRFDDVRNLRVHMIGVGGSGMSGLATILLYRGAYLSGCDARPSDQTQRLTTAGARITAGQEALDLPPDVDLVIASAAVPPGHPQLVEARARGIRTMKYAQALGWLMSHSTGVAIAGTHGKSTTTAWLTFILERAGLDPTFIVGGHVQQLGGGSRVGNGPFFIAEACEYDRSFLNLRPTYASILNIEADHLDYYADIHAIKAAFDEFAALVPPDGALLVKADDAHCAAVARRAGTNIVTFGDAPDADWRPFDLAAGAGRYSFNLLHERIDHGRVTLGPAGRHNVDNALAAAALAHRCGASWEAIRLGLEEFSGVGRRMTLCGDARGVRVVDDYGHHPTAVRVTLDAIREFYSPRRLWCVFQPHQYSRTRHMLDDFALSLMHADRSIVPDIFFVRDTAQDRESVSASQLVGRVRDHGGDARYIAGFDDIASFLVNETAPGDVVVTMGAGDIGKVADALLERLRNDSPA
jgi:UDP-N-acetylmuramate--alanine ligase